MHHDLKSEGLRKKKMECCVGKLRNIGEELLATCKAISSSFLISAQRKSTTKVLEVERTKSINLTIYVFGIEFHSELREMFPEQSQA